MNGLVAVYASIGLWLVALVVSVLPARVWPRLDPPFPLRRATAPSGVITMAAAVLFGLDQYLKYAVRLADANNQWMLQHAASNPSAALVPYAISVFTLFIFLFFTPVGLLMTYLAASGLLRFACAFITDDFRGDPILSGLDLVVTRGLAGRRVRRQQLARETREGPKVPDILATGAWAGLDADYVVIASRRKPEWESGAIMLTSDEWYRLGSPSDIELHGRLRTLYPLTRLETVEVVRRGIQYELPRLSPKYASPRGQSAPH